MNEVKIRMAAQKYNEYRALLKKGRYLEAANLAEMEYLQSYT